MSPEITTAIISAVTTLIVSFGTWMISMRRERLKNAEETRTLFESYRDELRTRIEELKDDVTSVNSTIQNEISILEVKMDELTKQVEKHNQVVERTFRLEERVDSLLHPHTK